MFQVEVSNDDKIILSFFIFLLFNAFDAQNSRYYFS